MEIRSYCSKVYTGANFDAIAASYYGSSSYPSGLYEVCYRVHTDNAGDPYWQYRVDCVYRSRAAALRRAREIARNW